MAYAIPGFICGNSPATFSINGKDLLSSCTGAWISPLPSGIVAVNGGYCIQGTSTSGNGYVNF